jgi:acyl-CoA dehydrogenase
MSTETLAREQTEAAALSAMIVEQADRLFRGEVTKERMAQADRGEWPSAIWDAVDGAGLTSALVPEARGGSGLPAADALRLVRRAGYHTLPVPFAETMIVGGLWSEAAGATLGGPSSLAPAGTTDRIGIERRGDNYVLHGQAHRVPWAAHVDQILVHAHDANGSALVALVPRALVRSERRCNLANEPRDTLLLEGVSVPAQHVRPAPSSCAEGFLPVGALLRSLQMVGAMERCLDYTIQYAMERQQFGRPIAKFQAIQHMLAEAAGHYAAAAAASELAAEAFGRDDFAFAAAIAKSRVGEAAGKVAEVCHQVHGAMGFTQEHPLHFATRRLWSWRDEFGNESYWQERIGRIVCSAGGEALWERLVGS